MRALIRADADARIGGGHVGRGLALGGALEALGHAVAYRVNAGAEAVVPALARVRRDDGAEPGPADVVVVDHYGVGWREERALAAATGARLVVAIDDLADRVHDCGLLVDGARAAEDYRGLVTPGAARLTGPCHALLRPDFAALRPASLARRAGPRLSRVVVTFGLSDATPAVAAALGALGRVLPDAEVEVIVGPAGVAGASALLDRHPRARLLVAPPDYAARLAAADLAVGAAGVAALERCALGLPSLVVPIADNQAASTAALAAAGAALVVPAVMATDTDALASGLVELRDRPERLAALSRAAAGYCDGAGAGRVAAAILRLADAPPQAPARVSALRLRPATMADARVLWAWRNDAETRAASRDGEPIPWERHRAWLAARLAVPGTTRILVALEGDEPVGSFRLDRRDGAAAEISLALSPLRRGVGLGHALLAAGLEASRDFAPRLVATVHEGNAPSRRLFEASGFHTDGAGPWLRYALDPDPEAEPFGN